MNAEQLARVALIPMARAELWVGPLLDGMVAYEINTVSRQAAFIAETSYESAAYTALVENLTYPNAQRIADVWPSRFASAHDAAYYVRKPEALANFVYSNRLGNGDEESGDGWLYRGRGCIMGTGRAFYEWLSTQLGENFVAAPQLLEQPPMAALASACWWADKGLNEIADTGAIDRCTRIVNGPAMLGRLDRWRIFNRGLKVLTH